MPLISFLTSAVGGALLGELGRWLSSILEVWKANKESERKLKEMRALADIKIEEGQWDAFRESLKAGDSEYTIPEGLTGVWLGVVSTALLLVHIATKSVRIFLVAWAAYFLNTVYSTSVGAEKELIARELLTICFAVLYWWIGERYQKRTTKT